MGIQWMVHWWVLVHCGPGFAPPPSIGFFSSLWIIDEMVQMVLEGGRSLYLKASGIK
jgi:hypothetical protein